MTEIESIPLMPMAQLKVIKCIYQEKTYEIQIEPYSFVNELIPEELKDQRFNVIHFGTKLYMNKSIEYYAGRIRQYGSMVHLTPPSHTNPQQAIEQPQQVSADDLYMFLIGGILSGFLFSIFTLIPLRLKNDEYSIFKAGCVVGLVLNVALKLFISED